MELIEKAHLTLLKDYLKVRHQTMTLCKPLRTEDFVVQPIVDVSPPKWHLGHTTWFFETFLLQTYYEGYQEFDPNYGFVFNSYYESVGERVVRTNRGNLSRPTVEDVLKYRAYVDQHMAKWLESTPELSERIIYLLQLGMNHEQQHQELLLTDIKYILGNNPLLPAYQSSEEEINAPAPQTDFAAIDGGLYQIGYEGDGFHYDNEKGVHQVFLEPFEIRKSLVTVGEYLDFIDAGGYENFRYWLSDGWDWVNQHKVKAPMYWHQVKGEWHCYTLAGLKPLSLNEPVTHISYYEADAFARWKGLRLPTEAEWEVACRLLEPAVTDNAHFVESERYHPEAAKDAYQFYGDAWEWTQSAYLPYPHFKTEEGAVGEYNGKFMINQMVLRGGSCATPKNHIRYSYRNFFQPNLRWQFTGIRLARYTN